MESTALRLSLSSTQVPTLSYPIAPFVSQFQSLGLSPKTIARDRKDASYQNWNLMVRAATALQFVGQLGYVGSVGHHLFSKYTVNLHRSRHTATRPLAGFSSFGLKTNDGNSTFNALQVSLQRKLSQADCCGRRSTCGRTRSLTRPIGAGEATTIQNMACRACDRSNTQFDIRHTITMSAVLQTSTWSGHGSWQAIGKFGGWKSAVSSRREPDCR